MSVEAKQLHNQDATWYKEVGLGPAGIVLDRDPAPPVKKGGHSTLPPYTRTHFSTHVCCGQTAEWILPLGIEVGLSLVDIVLDPDPPPEQKGAQHPTFRPMSIVAKWSPMISPTAGLSI